MRRPAPRPDHQHRLGLLVGVGMYSSMLCRAAAAAVPRGHPATAWASRCSRPVSGWPLAASWMMIVSPLGGKLTNARGPKFTLISGVLVITAGYAPVDGPDELTPGASWSSVSSSTAASASPTGAMPALIMSSVPLSGDRRRQRLQHPHALPRHLDRRRGDRRRPRPDDPTRPADTPSSSRAASAPASSSAAASPLAALVAAASPCRTPRPAPEDEKEPATVGAREGPGSNSTCAR
ncbi:hypothetical protein ACRAWF_20015 [Streptomyces sp. L7]